MNSFVVVGLVLLLAVLCYLALYVVIKRRDAHYAEYAHRKGIELAQAWPHGGDMATVTRAPINKHEREMAKRKSPEIAASSGGFRRDDSYIYSGADAGAWAGCDSGGSSSGDCGGGSCGFD